MSTPDPSPRDGIDAVRSGYRDVLRVLLIQMAPPYGFTLATFTASGVTLYEHSTPHPLEILLFLVGSFAGYAMLASFAGVLSRMMTPGGVGMRGWQTVHFLPLFVVFLASWGLAVVVPEPWCWLTSGIALTVGYLGVLGLELTYLMGKRATPA
jgi:hypothetical protein